MKVLVLLNRWHFFHILVVLVSIGLWYLSAYFINELTFLDYTWHGLFNHLLTNGAYWLTVLLLCFAVLLKDIYFCHVERTFNYKPYHIIQEMDNELGGVSIRHVSIGTRASAVGYENNGVELNQFSQPGLQDAV